MFIIIRNVFKLNILQWNSEWTLVRMQKSTIISNSFQQQIGEFEGRLIKVESSFGTIEKTFVKIQSTFDHILTFNDIQLRFFSKKLKSCEDLIGYGITDSGHYYLSKGQKIPKAFLLCFNSYKNPWKKLSS